MNCCDVYKLFSQKYMRFISGDCLWCLVGQTVYLLLAVDPVLLIVSLWHSNPSKTFCKKKRDKFQICPSERFQINCYLLKKDTASIVNLQLINFTNTIQKNIGLTICFLHSNFESLSSRWCSNVYCQALYSGLGIK